MENGLEPCCDLRWAWMPLLAHHSSIWRDFRDSVSFSWQAICKTDLLLHAIPLTLLFRSPDKIKLPKQFVTYFQGNLLMKYHPSSINIRWNGKQTRKVVQIRDELQNRWLPHQGHIDLFFQLGWEGSGNPESCARMWMMKLTTTDCSSRKTFSGRKVSKENDTSMLGVHRFK